MKVPSYLIIGCGHFGSRAAEQLLKKEPHSKIIAVDKNPRALKKLSYLSRDWEGRKGKGPLSFLRRMISNVRE